MHIVKNPVVSFIPDKWWLLSACMIFLLKYKKLCEKKTDRFQNIDYVISWKWKNIFSRNILYAHAVWYYTDCH